MSTGAAQLDYLDLSQRGLRERTKRMLSGSCAASRSPPLPTRSPWPAPFALEGDLPARLLAELDRNKPVMPLTEPARATSFNFSPHIAIRRASSRLHSLNRTSLALLRRIDVFHDRVEHVGRSCSQRCHRPCWMLDTP